jgi:hypothetical protein
VRCRGSKAALSEAETRSGSGSLEQGGGSPEGASGPRARRGLARGGVRPSSEACPQLLFFERGVFLLLFFERDVFPSY